jgi:EthD domain
MAFGHASVSDPIVLKLIIAGRRADGITQMAAHSHLRDVHGAMVVRPPIWAGPMPVGYVQNHVRRGAYSEIISAHSIERDLVTELWFEDIAHLQASTTTPYYKQKLQPDEPNFVDQATVERMLCAVSQIDKPGPERFKTFVFLRCLDFASTSEMGGLVSQWLKERPGFGRLQVNIPLQTPDGDRPFADLIIEAWFATIEAADGVVDDVASLYSGVSGVHIDASQSFVVSAEEYSTERLRAEIPRG